MWNLQSERKNLVEEREGKGTVSEYYKKTAYGDRDSSGITETEKLKEREKEVSRVVHVYVYTQTLPLSKGKTCVGLTIPEVTVPFTGQLQTDASRRSSYSASWPCSMSDNQKFRFLVPALTIRCNCLLSSSFNGKSHSCCQSMNVTIIYLFSHFTVVLVISGRSLYTHLINGNPASNDLQSKLLIQESTCTHMLFK